MKKVFALAALLLLALPVFAADFTVGASPAEQTVCATDTILYVLDVQNGGGSTDSYTVSVSGDAAKWAVAAPAGFTLKPQETTQAYIYVTPVSGANPGAYDLKVKINGQETLLKVNVGDCHSTTLTADVTEQSICADTTASYQLTLANTGKYTETFDLSLTGTAAKWATLSENTIKLTAGQTAQITTTVTPPADQTGLLDLTVTAKAGNSNAAASLQLGVQSNNCYEFNLMPDKNYLSFCENSEAKIPLTIVNTGNVDNTYTVSAAGPRWISVEQERLDVPAGGSRTTNLILFPDYGVSGDFKINVRAESDRGEIVSEQRITANVETCHSTDLKISAAEDTLCPFTTKAYAISLKNTGTFDERYAVTVTGSDFATVDKSFVDVPAGQLDNINLLVDTADYPAGNYQINVMAEAQDPAHAKSTDSLMITIVPKESCFGVLTTAALTKVQAAPGEGTLVPVIVENKGTEQSTYNLEVSGTGAAYAKLNPAVLTIEGRRAKTAYIYIAVPEETARKEYMLTVSARLEDGTVSSSSGVILDVVAPIATVTSATQKPAEETQITTSAVEAKLNALRSSVIAFFGKVENFGKAKITQIKEFFSRNETAGPGEEEKIEGVVENISEETAGSQFLSEAAQQKLSEASGQTQEAIKSAGTKLENFLSGVPGFDTLSGLKNKVASINLPGEKPAEGSSVQRIKDNVKKIVGFNASASGFAASAKTFLFEKTYKIPNWAWLTGIIIILAVISYILKEEEPEGEKPKVNGNNKGKGMWQKFMDWLEEEDEVKPEGQKLSETKPEEPKLKANDILKEVVKEQQEQKDKSKSQDLDSSASQRKPKPAPKKRGRPRKK